MDRVGCVLVVALVLVVVSAVVVFADQPPAASHDVLQQFPVPSDAARRPVPLAAEPGDQISQEDNMEGAESRHYHHKGGRKGGKKWGR
ncbi:hypothetical protein pipiens_000937, partial [Culex pipiens pipiens]